MPAVAEEIQEKVLPEISETRTTAVLDKPEHTSCERLAFATFGLGFTCIMYPAGGPGQDPDEAAREAVMLYVTAFCAIVGLPGVKDATGFEVPLAGGQNVIPGSQVAVQLYVAVSPVTLVCRLIGCVAVALQITCWLPGEVRTEATGFTLNVKSDGVTGEQPAAVGMI